MIKYFLLLNNFYRLSIKVELKNMLFEISRYENSHKWIIISAFQQWFTSDNKLYLEYFNAKFKWNKQSYILFFFLVC